MLLQPLCDPPSVTVISARRLDTVLAELQSDDLIHFFERSKLMDVKNSKPQSVYARRLKKYSKNDLSNLAIIFAFIFISTLISVLMPIYLSNTSLLGH